MKTLTILLLIPLVVTAESLDTTRVFQNLLGQVEKTYTRYQQNHNLMTKSSVYSWEMLPATQFPYQCGKDSLRKDLPLYTVGGKDSILAKEWDQPLRVRVMVRTFITRNGESGDRISKILFFQLKGFWEEWRTPVSVTETKVNGQYECMREY